MSENEKEILSQLLAMIVTQTKDIEFMRRDVAELTKENREIKEILKNHINGGDNALHKLTTMQNETQEKETDILGLLAKGFNNITEKNPELAIKMIDKLTDKFGDSINKMFNIFG